MKMNQSMKTSMSLAAAVATIALSATSADAANIYSNLDSTPGNDNTGLNPGVTLSGQWFEWFSGPGGDGSMRHSGGTVAANVAPDKQVTWEFAAAHSNALVAGATYDVYASFGMRSDFSSTAPYTVSGIAGGPTTFFANMDTDDGIVWDATFDGVEYDLLGTVVIDNSGTTTVVLSNNVADGSFVIGDRVLFNAVPEPSSAALLGLGGLALLRRRRK